MGEESPLNEKEKKEIWIHVEDVMLSFWDWWNLLHVKSIENVVNNRWKALYSRIIIIKIILHILIML